MVNSEQFGQRLQEIMEFYDISAAAFADAIDVGRSSISHILSGRNKPSLDFVLKIVQTYPEVELYWLLNGKGKFPQEKDAPKTQEKPSSTLANKILPRDPEVPSRDNNSIPTAEKPSRGKDIQKIVIFYTDGSFDAYEN